MYTAYEKRVLQEIKDWELAKPGLIIKTIDAIGKPVSVIMENIPRSVRITVEKAVLGFMEMLKDFSYWTYSDKRIIKKANDAGLNIHSITDLAGQDIEKLDRIAHSFFNSNKIIAALEGAGCGLGGLGLIAADIPVLMGIGFRSIQQIGSSYGFNMQDPAMLPVVMSVYTAGSCSSVAVKSTVLTDMHIAAASLAGKTAYVKAAARTQTSLFVNFIERSTGSFPAQVAENLSKRKLSQLIPVVGAVIGAGFNYWLISSTMTSAYMIFRKLYFERKNSTVTDLPVIRGTGAPIRRRFRILRST